ncbi:MAG: hypothetical protein ACXVR1_12955 [Solirubrobacteraceae bacterium]
MDEVTRQRVGSALRRMGEDLVAERRRVMLLTRENEQLREEVERLRHALSVQGGVGSGSTTGSAPKLVGS